MPSGFLLQIYPEFMQFGANLCSFNTNFTRCKLHAPLYIHKDHWTKARLQDGLAILKQTAAQQMCLEICLQHL